MSLTIPTGVSFENLIQRLLESNGFSLIPLAVADRGVDFLADFGNERWAIEVKYYRTVRAQGSLIESAAVRLTNSALAVGAKRGMLVVSCIVPPELRRMIEEQHGVELLDRVDLRSWGSNHPALVEELDALVEANPSEVQAEPDPARKRSNWDWQKLRLLSENVRPSDTRGTQLCRTLSSVSRGKVAWAQYERVCADILKYLFPNDLHGWHKQQRTDDGLNRFDFVCRVRPTTEFWKFVIDHIDSRYILFEFKNYVGKIKQGQILTTEKYLLERGLRRFAIIFTRTGAEKNAVLMAQGAMREHGKLMLIVNDAQVCTMLHMKEKGEDPTDFLFELADEFLLKLPR